MNYDQMTYRELAKEGQVAWELMMQYIRSSLWSKDDPYRAKKIHEYNSVWLEINTRLRDGRYKKS